MARYLATQYLGEHGEALENVSWSWERTLGGSVTDAWEAVKNLTESLEEAIEAWHQLLGGSELELTRSSKYSTITKRVVPPPNLSIELVDESIHPPPQESSEPTITTNTSAMLEHDPAEGDRCQDCPSVIRRIPEGHEYRDRDEHDRAEFYCIGCKQLYAEPGEGGRQTVEIPVTDENYNVPTVYRQARLREFERDGRLCRS
jgi:hypothetical protein